MIIQGNEINCSWDGTLIVARFHLTAQIRSSGESIKLIVFFTVKNESYLSVNWTVKPHKEIQWEKIVREGQSKVKIFPQFLLPYFPSHSSLRYFILKKERLEISIMHASNLGFYFCVRRFFSLSHAFLA